MDDQKAILIEKIKNVIVEMVHYSETTGITIQNYIITHKIERAKELLLYDELNLTEISYRLNYSSVAHLSNQFKKVTGLTPTFFKQLRHKQRTMLDQCVNDVTLFQHCITLSGVQMLTFVS